MIYELLFKVKQVKIWTGSALNANSMIMVDSWLRLTRKMKHYNCILRRLEQLHNNKGTMHVGKVYIDRFVRWILIYFQIGFMQD